MNQPNPATNQLSGITDLCLKRPLFALGQVVITRHAQYLLTAHHIDGSLLVHRHQRGDWGDVSEEDKASNEEALNVQGRLFSSYQLPIANTDLKLWIITEWDRSVTTLLLPEDY